MIQKAPTNLQDSSYCLFFAASVSLINFWTEWLASCQSSKQNKICQKKSSNLGTSQDLNLLYFRYILASWPYTYSQIALVSHHLLSLPQMHVSINSGRMKMVHTLCTSISVPCFDSTLTNHITIFYYIWTLN